MTFYLIEHPERGLLNLEPTDEGRPSFSWSKLRDDDSLARYSSLNYALLDAGMLPGTYVVRNPRAKGEPWQKNVNGDWVDC